MKPIRQIKRALWIYPLVVVSAWCATAAHAAQVGRVSVDEAMVYQSADTASAVVARVSKGQPVAASNAPTKGFHRVRTKAGVMGWMLASDLVFRGGQMRSRAGGSGTGGGFKVRGMAGFALFKPKTFNDSLQEGTDIIANSLYFGGQAHYLITPKLSVGLRLEYLSKSRNVTFVDANQVALGTYKIGVKSMPVTLGVEYTLLEAPSFAFGIAGDVGLGLGTEGTAALDSDVTKISGSGLTFSARLVADLKISPKFMITGELGYRSLTTGNKAVTLAAGGSGATLFGTSPAALAVNLSGPFVGVGAGLRF